MALVYKVVNGQKIERLIARLDVVQSELTRVANERAAIARSVLAAHVDQGHSEILVEKGTIDRYVILSDDRGYGAARSIEFGADYIDKHGNIRHSKPVRALGKAFGWAEG
ncbi:DUF5403 family protein [Cellulomonas sp. SG140]|uniref:DUF5403 family protein n=1 Tax=Cellulomonas sp. SG140 TaxID=2976536 RepID=UPI0021E6ED0F|nr:DUF5403 family protein [Cellulomonas sp. SG140]